AGGTCPGVESLTVTAPGDVTFCYRVTNTGNTTLSATVVVDDMATPGVSSDDATITVPTLAPSASATVTTTVTFDQAFIDADVARTNSAVATDTVEDVSSPPDTATVTPDQNPGLSLAKTVIAAGGTCQGAESLTVTEPGDVTFCYLVTNTGNTTLSATVVVDDMATPVDTSDDVTITVPELAPSASATVTATVTVDQDVIYAQVTRTNVARDHDTEQVVTSPPDTAAVDPEGTPGIQIVKSNDPTTTLREGDVVNYSFVVTNTGTVALTDVTLVDPLCVPAFTGGDTDNDLWLDLTETWTYGCSYTVDADDVAATEVVNPVTVVGDDRNPNTVNPTDDDEVRNATEPIPNPDLELVKTYTLANDVDADGVIDVDDTIEYNFAVTNTGDITLDVVVDDPMLGGFICEIPGLEPTFTGSCGPVAYQVTAADVAAGTITNVATATGDDHDPDTENPTDEDSTTIDRPDISLVKVAALVDENGNNLADSGETINYAFQITNSGAVTLSPVVLSDSLLGGVVCTIPTMQPGDVATCGPFGYRVTSADVVAGSVDNVATVTGDDNNPDTTDPTDEDDTTTPTGPVPNPAIQIQKFSPGEPVEVGDTITYMFVVSNTGNMDLHEVELADPLCTPTLVFGDLNGNSTLETNEQWTYTCDYVTTDADLAAGEVVNPVRVTAEDDDPETEDVSDEDEVTDPVIGSPALDLAKTVVAAGDACPGVESLTVTEPGDVTFCYLVTNTGNVTLAATVVIDDMATPGDPSDDVTIAVPELAPDASTTVTHTMAVDQAFIDAGVAAINVAMAHDAEEDVTSPPDTAEVDPDQNPALALAKTVVMAGGACPGVETITLTEPGTVTFCYRVTNTGNVTMSATRVVDDMATPVETRDDVTIAVPELAPGESVTVTSATVTLTQAFIDAGVTHTNVARAYDPDEGVSSPPDTATVDPDPPPSSPPPPGPGVTARPPSSSGAAAGIVPAGNLADTGGTPAPIALTASVLVGLGLVSLTIARRRQQLRKGGAR
ncbi:MAG: hypothetical protein ACK5OX_05080, partial [Desertimonas sp.]